jgi:putative transferase (TIGR04331 family)
MLTLVTTELEETWPEGGEILFLGEWCRRHDRKTAWANRLHRMVQYHWNDRAKLKRDFDRLQALNCQLLDAFVPVMNGLHGECWDERFWRLLLGYWLNVCTTVLLDRWTSIEYAATEAPLRTYVLPFSADQLACNDTTDFICRATEDAVWNHALYSMLVEKKSAIKKIYLPDPIQVSGQDGSSRSNNRFRQGVRHFINFFAMCWKRRDRYFLTSTYLPLRSLLFLELQLGQPPIPRQPVSWRLTPEFDPAMRVWSLPPPQDGDDFAVAVCELLPKLMPRAFLEGYRKLMARSASMSWPTAPRVIFTSNQHYSDDLFKAWAARKVAAGARLVIGEHGGLGVGLFNGAHRYELAIADRYLSTGWSDARSPQILPFVNFRTARNVITPDKRGKALLVCGIMPRYAFDIRAMMMASQVLDYLDEQFRFVAALPDALKSDTLIRLVSSDYGWDQKRRWQERFPEIPIDEGERRIWAIAAQCRLFISTYNATTYIESFSNNFPTLMFWNPSNWELKPEAEPYFALLKAAGIYHETPESAAEHIALIWNDVTTWWGSKAVQDARKFFCDAYASPSVDPVGQLRKILLKESRLGVSRL